MVRSLFRRVYRARPLYSFIMCLPGALLVAWYVWSAFARVDRYRRAVDDAPPWTLETFHIALHDLLDSDLRRMLMSPPPEPSSLYTYRLRIDRHGWDTLVGSAAIEDDRPYVEAKVEHDGRLLDAEVRLRGSRHWHVGGPQKSLKIKLEKGELIHGYRIFNLINDPTPMVVGQQLILDLTAEQDVLTPVSRFVRVRLNSKDLGVYHYETAADESLLRSSRRMPGAIYESSLPSSAPTEELWARAAHWTKVSSRTDTDEDRADFSDLERFLYHVHQGSSAEFDDYARHELDLEAFARLDAVDVAFGADQRDFRENHDYYFDPYRGRWEPIAGRVRGFRDDPEFNLVDNPVLLRLKMTPGYLSRRDRLLYELLIGDASPSAVRVRATELLLALAPELRTDPYWDAYRELPRIDSFHRRMVRPNTLGKLSLVVESELKTYADRHAALVSELERNPLYLHVGAVEGGAGAFSTPLTFIIDGRAGAALRELSLTFPSGCEEPELRLERAGAELPAQRLGARLELGAELELHPTIALAPQRSPTPRRGEVRGQGVPTAYPLTLRSSCPPQAISARARHLATDSRVVSRSASSELLARLPARRLAPGDVPALEVGEVATHPWDLERPPPRRIQLGPGDVSIEETRVYSSADEVAVAPGTRLRLGADASLVFLGKVTFAGQRHQPIVVEPLTGAAFGGVAIQGPATRGSRLEHTTVRGGRKPAWRSIAYPSMVNLHHTSDIVVNGCHFGQNSPDTDTFHAAYVDGLDMTDTTFTKIPGDALDLEFSRASLRRLHIINTGDEGLDLMGSQLTLSDSVILGARGNGVSAGEESVVHVRSTLIGHSTVGILAKNAADVALTGSVLYGNELGVKSYQRTVRYAGESDITADVLFVADSRKQAVDRDDRDTDRLDQGRLLLDLPQPGVLDHMLQNVLELGSWADLEGWIAEQRQEAVR